MRTAVDSSYMNESKYRGMGDLLSGVKRDWKYLGGMTGSISVEQSDGTILPFSEVFENMIKPDKLSRLSTFLFIDCQTIELHIKVDHSSSGTFTIWAWPANKYASDSSSVVGMRVSMGMDVRDLIEKYISFIDTEKIPRLLGLIFEDTESLLSRSNQWEIELYMLLVQRRQEHFERVDFRICSGYKPRRICPLTCEPDSRHEVSSEELTFKDWLPSETAFQRIRLG